MKDETKKRLREAMRSRGIDNDTAVAIAAAGIDEDAELARAKKRVTWQLWDKRSPINGVEASQILTRTDMPENGEVYLILIDDVVTMIQPHSPDSGEVLTKRAARAAAAAHTTSVAAELAVATITDTVGSLLESAGLVSTGEPVPIESPSTVAGAAGMSEHDLQEALRELRGARRGPRR